MSELDGIDCQDNFVEYFDSDFSFKKDIKDDYMYFSFSNEKLWTITEYISIRELYKEELENKEYLEFLRLSAKYQNRKPTIVE